MMLSRVLKTNTSKAGSFTSPEELACFHLEVIFGKALTEQCKKTRLVSDLLNCE